MGVVVDHDDFELALGGELEDGPEAGSQESARVPVHDQYAEHWRKIPKGLGGKNCGNIDDGLANLP